MGASHLRCDLAVRAPGAPGYQLAVLVDTAAHYRSGDALERYVQRPGVLASAGWVTTLVLAKDVQEDAPGVLRRLEAALRTPGEQLIHMMARSRRASSSDASISALRADTLSTFTPRGMPFSRAYAQTSA